MDFPDPEDLERMSRELEERNEEHRLKHKRLLVDGPSPDTHWEDPVRLWQEGGFWCAILENRIGSLCGYVLVPEGHPWWGLAGGDDVPEPVTPDPTQYVDQAMDDHGILPVFAMALEGTMENYAKKLEAQVQVHGGLTWAGVMPIRGAPWGWWIGFDCAHAGDAISPERVSDSMRQFNAERIADGDHVWTENEVAMEVSRMVVSIRLAQPKEEDAQRT